MEPLARGAAKISSFEFQYLHPLPLVILNELSLNAVMMHSERRITSKVVALWGSRRG